MWIKGGEELTSGGDKECQRHLLNVGVAGSVGECRGRLKWYWRHFTGKFLAGVAKESYCSSCLLFDVQLSN